MGEHLISGEFQSDKYPTCPRGKVPLSTKDPMAQDLLWEYAQRRRKIDPEFSADLEEALELSGFTNLKRRRITMDTLTVIIHYLKKDKKFLGDYQGITIKDADQDIILAEYGNEILDQGNEKANGFIDGITYVLTDLTIEYKNVADYENEEAWRTARDTWKNIGRN